MLKVAKSGTAADDVENWNLKLLELRTAPCCYIRLAGTTWTYPGLVLTTESLWKSELLRLRLSEWATCACLELHMALLLTTGRNSQAKVMELPVAT